MAMEIIRNPDGSLVVPIPEGRHHDSDDVVDAPPGDNADAVAEATTRVLHPGEGGYDEALVEWDLEQNPDRAPVVSTAGGRHGALAVVHAVAASPHHDVSEAVAALDDPGASGEALRFVLVGGVHSV